MTDTMAGFTATLERSLNEFVRGIVGAVPELLAGLVFLTLAYVAIRIIQAVLRSILGRAYPTEQRLIVDFIVIVVSIFLWFGVGLTLLSIVGLGGLAASLGTAAGFIALGISYALSEMIEDTVAGVYLLRDADFNPGDTVIASAGTGVLTEIGLRKSRFRLENGDTLVVANRDVESKWTKKAESADGTGAASDD
ncbi:mechanosensitive ion channel domain-containing protein [Halorientalis marina]|uniref:mechanosensitive ion channel domain-containing protein n=1 Tax=Halorientalis marina TaxID=2931976 RepID=UPI001FF50C12|nr:mechanosensitive ion channel domain-containing protein [Halorientalis marina]